MPIFLAAPAHRPTGPDGQGWNRLTAGIDPSAQCALRPRSYAALVEGQDTRRARWGGYGPCIRGGDCDGCPIASAAPRQLISFTPDVLVRILPRGDRDELHVMNRPDRGWDSGSVVWSWEQLARVVGWRVGRPHRDEHSDGFWLHQIQAPTAGLAGVGGSR
ncbi:hypothetical protein [Thermobispora bispora]|uniref:hypothetical protein n=1 Tax=Thermobispora bispora TaxID=2006 RepID=UPI0019809C33|nr:hypothetical protein [Thermobispora bispora]QSI49976.1 hypothetical protein CYL17_18545 [Thermobispora bispora]